MASQGRKLRVQGVTDLCVVDGSLAPQVVALNPSITAMLITERATGLTRGEQQC